MPLTSVQAKKIAKSQVRDAQGHFIKGANVKAGVAVGSPVEGLEQGRKAEDPERSRKTIPEFEKPLVSISVNNPFKKILYWLDRVRRHQTTTFALKLSIPLIALPVVILGVFSLGRVYGINFQKSQTPISPITSISLSPQPDPQISRAGTLKIAVGTDTKYLLSLKNGELVVLQIPPSINLVKYKDKQVLATGTYNKNTAVLTVTDIAEVQLFNSIDIPQSTSSSSTQ